MGIILIISGLIAFLFTIVLWKIWKWLEYRAWIEPARFEAFIKAIHLMGEALLLASTAIGKFGISMQEAMDVTDRIKLAKGGIGGEFWAQKEDGSYISVEKIEVGEKKDGAWPITITGKPINDGN